jgi:hypothetical protein
MSHITAFAKSTCGKLYGYATQASVVLFDCLDNTRPIVHFRHHVGKGIPRVLIIESFPDDRCKGIISSGCLATKTFL